MSARNFVSKLPTELRSELEQRLIVNGFSNYRELSDWLGEQGYGICKSIVRTVFQKTSEALDFSSVVSPDDKAETLILSSPI